MFQTEQRSLKWPSNRIAVGANTTCTFHVYDGTVSVPNLSLVPVGNNLRWGGSVQMTFVCCLLAAKRPSNMLLYLRDGSEQTILRAATLK